MSRFTISRWKKYPMSHECELEQIEEHVTYPQIPPYAPLHQKLRFRFKQFLTISEKNHLCRQYFRSNAGIKKERTRHQCTPLFRFTIHPLSMFATVREMVMCLLWSILLIIEPFFGYFMAAETFKPRSYNLAYERVMFSLNLAIICDLVVCFFLGFIIDKTREIVLEPGRIVRHYLFRHFFFDLASVASSFAEYALHSAPSTTQMCVYQIRLFRFVRVKSVSQYFDNFLNLLKVRNSLRLCVVLFLRTTLLIHWWTCALAAVPVFRRFSGRSTKDSWTRNSTYSSEVIEQMRAKRQLSNDEDRVKVLQRYLEHATLTMTHYYGAFIKQFTTKSETEMLVLSLVLISGLLFYIFCIAHVIKMFGMVNISEGKYEELILEVENFMTKKHFSPELRSRMMTYYQYKFDLKFFKEDVIFDSLSEHLRMEVLLYSCRTLIDNVIMFKGISKEAVGCIIARLKHEVYLPGDMVKPWYDISGTIYFITFGTCAIYVYQGRELMHLEDGNSFGLALEQVKDANIYLNLVAIETSDIYCLEKSDIRFCCREYPEIASKLESAAYAKVRIYFSKYAKVMEYESELEVSDVTDQLRRGKILEQGNKRELVT